MSVVLVVSINYWPEETGIGPYSTGMAEHLAHAGHDVTVLSGMPHYPQWQVDVRYRGKWRVSEERGGVRIIRRRHYVPGRQSAVRRAAYEASWLAHAAMVGMERLPEAVLGVIPSLSGGAIARLAAARARAGYGVVVQDLVSAAARQSGIRGGDGIAAVTRQAEAWSLRRATVVAPVAEVFRPSLLAMGVLPARITLLPNWSRLGSCTADRASVRARLGWSATDWVVLHAGNMGLKQGLEQVLDVGRLADRVGFPVRLVLMGDGSQRNELEQLAAGIACLEFRPFVPASELAEVLGAADVLLLSERPSVIDMSLPSKLTSYFAAGRPVVAAVSPAGGSAREVQLSGAGVIAPAGDASATLHAIMALRERPEQARALGEAGRTYARHRLSGEATFRQVDAIIERLVTTTKAKRGRGSGA